MNNRRLKTQLLRSQIRKRLKNLHPVLARELVALKMTKPKVCMELQYKKKYTYDFVHIQFYCWSHFWPFAASILQNQAALKHTLISGKSPNMPNISFSE